MKNVGGRAPTTSMYLERKDVQNCDIIQTFMISSIYIHSI
jgi:hypothetical protein